MKSDRGSIAPLAIGLGLFSLACMLVVYSASSLFVFQKRLTNYSESAVLYVANSGGDLEKFVEEIWKPEFDEPSIDFELIDNHQTYRVISCALWSNPLPIHLLPLQLRVCSNANARNYLMSNFGK